MAIQFSNLASTTLASGVSSTATSVSVTSASSFPTLGSGDYFYATIGAGSLSEIVKVTGISGTTFTVLRGQDDTTAVSHSSGADFALRVTAGALADLRDGGQVYTAGSGLGLADNEFTNTAPDQTVALTGAGTTSVSGTYPNFTITGAGTTYTAGSGLSLNGTEFANTAPDQTVALTGAGATSISGTYPNFTITSTDTNTVYTHPSAHSISFITGLQTALDGKVDDSQVLTNVPSGALFTDTVYTLPFTNNSANWNTAYGWGDHSTESYATETYVGNQITALVDSSPATMDTLNELAAALGDDPNFATTVSTSIGTKWTQDNTKISQWNTAYGWGNHASAGYFSAGNKPAVADITGLIEGTSFSGTYPIVFNIGGANRLFSENNITYTGATNTLNINGNTAWHAGNDGSGSGLDADLLDGQQGSYYAPASHNHSGVYLPISGKAADSELLDGIDSTGFVKQLSLGTSPNYQTPSSRRVDPTTSNPTNAHHAISTFGNGGNVTGQLATHFVSGQAYTRGYNSSWSAWRTQWDSLNDGSGSGLDADLLDGQHGSYYAPASSIPSVGNGTLTVTTSGSASGGGTFTANQSGNTTINISATDTNTTYNFGGSAFTSRNSGNPIAIDSVTTNMVGYVNTSTAAGFSDGAGFSAAYSGSWVGQLFVDFRTGKLSSRGKNNGTWQSHRFMWDNFNDGSGSGLDADLLDGQQGSYYYSAGNPPPLTADPTLTLTGDVTGSATFTNLGNATLTAVVNNDSHFHSQVYIPDTRGAQRAPSYYPDRYTSFDFQQNTDTLAGGDTWNVLQTVSPWSSYASTHRQQQLAWTGTGGLKFRYATSDSAWAGWQTLWTSSNDGSGSGLDADLLDGQQGSYYYSAANPPPTYSKYLRSDADDSFSGALTSTARNNGIFGTYDSYKTDHIWSMGTAYKNNSAGTNFGSLYGLAYKHTNNTTGGTMGGGHQMVWCNNGTPRASIGYDRFWHAASGTLWGSSNDGSGSGLDADLLDGINSASFLRSDTTDTASGFISLRAGGDHLANHSFASASSTSTGYSDAGIEVREGNYGAANGSAPRIGMHWGGRVASNISMDTSGYITIRNNPGTAYESFRANNIYANGTNLVWNTGNDGSGSGLDADLLDGQQGSYYLPTTGKAADSNLLDGIDSSRFIYGDGAQKSRSVNTFQAQPSGFFFYSGATGAPTAEWYNWITCRGNSWGNGGEYSFQLANSFWNKKLYFQHVQTGGYQGWAEVWTSSTDGSGSGLDADLLDGYNSDNFLGKFGNSYFQANTWIQHTGAHGLYAPTINDAHFYPNTAGSYGTWRINGSRNGYTGIYLNNGGGVVTGMYDAAGNGGDYYSGRWHFYFHRGNACLGVSGSSTSSSYGLYEQGGGIYSTGNIVAYSDRRVKENIRTIDNALETVEEMRGVYYNRIDDEEKKTVIGFIAQEVDEIEGAKPLVTYAEDVDQYGVSYGNTAALLVEAVKELSQQVKDLKAEIEEIKNA